MPQKSKIQELADFGQSVWLDYISRSLMESGRLQRLLDLGLRGMTSNPTIFDKAISTSSDYDDQIIRLKGEGKNPFEIYDALTIQDIRKASDLFLPVYEETSFLDGYVSLEIDPRLAMKASESIAEGRRLYQAVNRPNLMIKVPATQAGFEIAEELLAEGINVNMTLIFSLDQYIQTAWAYLKGLNRLSHKTKDLTKPRSVASVFVSRVDTVVDNLLQEKIKKETDPASQGQLEIFLGKAAVENARRIFEKFQLLFNSDLFQNLKTYGAEPQRVLWASTGTKNPQYRDIKYVTELISRPTVNTLPEDTLNAFLDHGQVLDAFHNGSSSAKDFFESLSHMGIDINHVCAKLLSDGLVAFEKSFNSLLNSIESKSQSICVR